MKKVRTILVYGLAIFCTLIGSAYGKEGDDLIREINKKTVVDFYQKAINEKDFKAAEAYLGDKYIQHNPKAADGKEGLKAFIDYLKAKAPDYHSEIKKVFVDKDFVILHVHNIPKPGEPGKAIVDIFRLEKGKIVEHWDVIQQIPETSANSNGMF